MNISQQNNIYAYDAYVLDCAIRHKAPLLTLENRMKAVAHELRIETMEV